MQTSETSNYEIVFDLVEWQEKLKLARIEEFRFTLELS